MWFEAAQLLATNFMMVLSCLILLWGICLITRDPTPMDSFWAFGLALVAITSFCFTGGASPRKILMLSIAVAWGLRLGCYVLLRWRGHGPDPRYAKMMKNARDKFGWSYPYASLRLVFLTQAPLLWITSLPVQLGQFSSDAAPLGGQAIAGAALAIIGIVFESVGDWQLSRFKAAPANQGKVMNRGLWRYTRHPNYFGDACVWWGLYIIAAETFYGKFSILGPAFLTFTLVKWSGAALLERRMLRSKPHYADYIATTSSFFPWFPKKSRAEEHR
jgi:steroid 5-alpha reductase family enzyme